jgi:hypothetical protein
MTCCSGRETAGAPLCCRCSSFAAAVPCCAVLQCHCSARWQLLVPAAHVLSLSLLLGSGLCAATACVGTGRTCIATPCFHPLLLLAGLPLAPWLTACRPLPPPPPQQDWGGGGAARAQRHGVLPLAGPGLRGAVRHAENGGGCLAGRRGSGGAGGASACMVAWCCVRLWEGGRVEGKAGRKRQRNQRAARKLPFYHAHAGCEQQLLQARLPL